MIEKPADTEQAISSIIAERWSSRAYDANTAVNDEMIISLCEAARWAPSCYGDQPWRFLVWNRFDNEALWQKAVDCLSPSNREWARNAPVLILVSSVETFSKDDGGKNRWSGFDSGAAAYSLCLQATSLGLVSHQMGGFDSEALTQAFSLPDDLQLWSIIAIGYSADINNLSETQLKKELSARKRRPLNMQFYRGNWNTPITSGE